MIVKNVELNEMTRNEKNKKNQLKSYKRKKKKGVKVLPLVKTLGTGNCLESTVSEGQFPPTA